jgi:hypothetical protein
MALIPADSRRFDAPASRARASTNAGVDTRVATPLLVATSETGGVVGTVHRRDHHAPESALLANSGISYPVPYADPWLRIFWKRDSAR